MWFLWTLETKILINWLRTRQRYARLVVFKFESEYGKCEIFHFLCWNIVSHPLTKLASFSRQLKDSLYPLFCRYSAIARLLEISWFLIKILILDFYMNFLYLTRLKTRFWSIFRLYFCESTRFSWVFRWNKVF